MDMEPKIIKNNSLDSNGDILKTNLTKHTWPGEMCPL